MLKRQSVWILKRNGSLSTSIGSKCHVHIHPTRIKFSIKRLKEKGKEKSSLRTYFLLFTEADYTLDDSFWNEESPVGG
jgi:hypothetical protein